MLGIAALGGATVPADTVKQAARNYDVIDLDLARFMGDSISAPRCTPQLPPTPAVQLPTPDAGAANADSKSTSF
jgi:hypothetical protein